jgi:hypothetical protein
VTPDQIAAIQPRCTNTNGRADGYMMSSCAASAWTSGDMATKFLGVSRFPRTFFIRTHSKLCRRSLRRHRKRPMPSRRARTPEFLRCIKPRKRRWFIRNFGRGQSAAVRGFCDVGRQAYSGMIGAMELKLQADVGLRSYQQEEIMGRGLLLWLIGIPIPIILVIWLFGGLH